MGFEMLIDGSQDHCSRTSFKTFNWFIKSMSARISTERKYISPFRFQREPPVLDTGGEDESIILQRFDDMARTLVIKGYKLDGSCKQQSLLDWSVCYAFQGGAYFDEVQSQLNYTVLHAALLLTIAMPAYMNPPDFTWVDLRHWFMALVGLSSVSNLMSIIAATIFSTILNRPYTNLDAMVLRVTDGTIMVIAIVFDYIGQLSLLTAVLISGFNDNKLDGYVQLYSIGVVVMITFFWVRALGTTDISQLEKVQQFKTKYLDEDGQLKAEWSMSIYKPSSIEDFLAHIDCAQYASAFVSKGIDLDAALEMDKSDLIEIGITSIRDRLRIQSEIKRVAKL